ncbi:MAG: sulfotransferase family 2 domain-containing protein [Bacteroidota bacterium]
MKSIIERLFDIEISRKNKRQIINEAINLDKNVLFVAIPKTGTTSVRRQMRPNGVPIIDSPHLNIQQLQDLIYVYCLKQSLGKNYAFPDAGVLSDKEVRIKSKEVFDNLFKFSAVRNPWARAVSLYARREGVQVKSKMAFKEFCRHHYLASDTCLYPTLHKSQLDWLRNSDGDIIMDYVYKVEEFDEAIIKIKERTNGGLILKNIRLNSNPSSNSNSYRDLYDSESRKLVYKNFEEDIDYFKYTFEK